MAKRPTPAAKSAPKPVSAEPVAAPAAPISAPEVHDALDAYRNAVAHADAVGRPAIEAEAAALKHLATVSGLGDALNGVPLSAVTAQVKAVLSGSVGG